MLKNTYTIFGLVFIICQLLILTPATAKDKLPLDAVVIMDSSGSMKYTDPKQLRKPAAKLFITLLGSEDKLSVMSFSSKGWPIRIGNSKQFLTQLKNAETKDQAFKATDKISHKGMHTNIHAALTRGIELVKHSRQQQRDPILVLMSDGKMDVGNKARSAALRESIVSDLIPQLKEYGIKVYSVAFTQGSDQELLQEIADASDGRYALAESDDVLHKVFARIFEQSKEPNMLPLTENKFMVDTSIQEITIIANKKNDKSKILLQSPDGKRHNATSKKMKWFVSTGFDMITMQKPAEGEWKILFSDDDNKAYIVADMQLRSDFNYNAESYSPELTIKTWLKKDDEILSNNELLKDLELIIEIEHPDKKLEKLSFNRSEEEGIFETLFKPTMNGIYSATVIVTSKTFQRQQFFSFRAAMPTEPEPVIEPEPEPAKEPATIEEPATPEEVKAEEHEPVAEESDVTEAIIIFVISNIVLIFIGFNVYFVYRMIQKKKQTKANSEEK